jgi:hypothetical protein
VNQWVLHFQLFLAASSSETANALFYTRFSGQYHVLGSKGEGSPDFDLVGRDDGERQNQSAAGRELRRWTIFVRQFSAPGVSEIVSVSVAERMVKFFIILLLLLKAKSQNDNGMSAD